MGSLTHELWHQGEAAQREHAPQPVPGVHEGTPTARPAGVTEAMVEAAARAVYLKADPGTNDDWRGEEAKIQEYYRGVARAALEAAEAVRGR